jgi:hypothetical protein
MNRYTISNGKSNTREISIRQCSIVTCELWASKRPSQTVEVLSFWTGELYGKGYVVVSIGYGFKLINLRQYSFSTPLLNLSRKSVQVEKDISLLIPLAFLSDSTNHKRTSISPRREEQWPPAAPSSPQP